VISRSTALHHLSSFLERVPAYASQRNFDRPGHAEVSCLSKWIRYRVITEEECVNAVLAHHSFEVAEKFIQELMWRTYWKGWLELRPQVWKAFRERLTLLHDEFSNHEGYLQAIEGRTGLTFFDDWVQELRLTGYLHNHARMWFASVWIFTLQLPWQLGADFMYRHLLDGDPASNTLSWRWVGGLHTPGKFYVARPDNIERYSEGRWCPKDSELNLNPRPLPMDDSGELVSLETVSIEMPRSDDLVLLHDDDLSADLSEELAGRNSRYLLWDRSVGERSSVVREHLEQLRCDVRERTSAASVANAEAIVSEASRRSSTRVHTIKPHCGEIDHEISGLKESLSSHGIEVVFHRRRWDALYFPRATSGFFSFWSPIKRKFERAS
jgi:deoxyribodipyrimidine photo-lyase